MAEALDEATTRSELYEAYQRYFQVIPADNEELLDEAYKLRYHVYCIEHSFEDPAQHATGRETDAYDRSSVHSLLIHRPTGTIAGTVRLVLPDRSNPVGSLPIDRVCSDSSFLALSSSYRRHMGEVSRFAVSRSFRRRIGESGSPTGVTEESLAAEEAMRRDMQDRRIAPHITLGLIQSLVAMSAQYDIRVWSSVMEKALLRLLDRIGIHFENLGPEVEYHGKRQPCHAEVARILHSVRLERPEVWDVLTDRGRIVVAATSERASD